MQQDYFSIQDAAQFAGVDPMTIRRWIAKGIIKASRIGPKVVRIHRDDLDAAFIPVMKP